MSHVIRVLDIYTPFRKSHAGNIYLFIYLAFILVCVRLTNCPQHVSGLVVESF